MHMCRLFGGEVRFEAEGDAAGRLLTLAANDGVRIWDTKRNGEILSARCAARDYKRLRAPAKRCGLRMRIREKVGIAFVLRKYHARPGLIVGFFLFVALLFFFTGRIWSLELHGLNHANETEIRALLASKGVSVGAPIHGIDPTSVQLAALEELKDISWLSVNIHGCVARVEIKETNIDEIPTEPNAPSNLVALRDGIVREVLVTEGETIVQVGDAVAEGALLASGITATNQGLLIRRACGTVLAETTREISVSVTLSEALLLPCGSPYQTIDLHFFGLLLPFSSSVPTDGAYRVEEFDRLLTMHDTHLPLGVKTRRFTPLSLQTVQRTEEEAAAMAEEKLQKQEELLQSEAEILERQITRSLDGERLTLRAQYRCVENIAKEIPLHFDGIF